MSPESQNARFNGVICEKCGITLPTSSAAEIHRYEAHTPKGVSDYFIELDMAMFIKNAFRGY